MYIPDLPLVDKRILVTGASGFIGSCLVDRLVQLGAVVTAISRSEGRLGRLATRERFSHRQCDLTNEAEVGDLVRSASPQIIFHLASQPDSSESFQQSRQAIMTNVMGTLNLLESFRALESGAELFVYGDSCKVYGNAEVPYRAETPLAPLSSYALSKASGWGICQLYANLYNTPVVSVRPTLIYGPSQGFNLITYVVECVLGDKPEVKLDGGEQTRDPLFIQDAIEVLLAVASRGSSLSGQVINIGGNSEYTVREIAEMVIELMGARTPVTVRPNWARPTETWRSYCDNKEAQELLGWQPSTTLMEGLRLTIEHILSKRADSAPLPMQLTTSMAARTGPVC